METVNQIIEINVVLVEKKNRKNPEKRYSVCDWEYHNRQQ